MSRNGFENRQEIFLEYVIVDTKPNGTALETLAFDKSYQQEHDVLELGQDDSDCENHDPPFRRSLSTPTLMGSFRIEPLFAVKITDLQRMKRIGYGSQSDVFIANYKNKKVAVKVMKNHYENEIDNLRKLKHRSIVSFIGACSEASEIYIVMEYCERGRLFDYIKDPEQPITPGSILEWSYQIAAGMSYLHRNNIIHRDLKSPNILMKKDFSMKISDFGLSKPKLADSAKMPFAGTVSWMAPEVIRMEACSETVDVWSYGVVLWELFTLQTPYEGFEQTSIIFGIGNYTLSLPLPTTFLEPFRELIKDCWNVEPDKRPSFKSIVKMLRNDCRQMAKFPMKKFTLLQRDWKTEYELFQSRKDLFLFL